METGFRGIVDSYPARLTDRIRDGAIETPTRNLNGLRHYRWLTDRIRDGAIETFGLTMGVLLTWLTDRIRDGAIETCSCSGRHDSCCGLTDRIRDGAIDRKSTRLNSSHRCT